MGMLLLIAAVVVVVRAHCWISRTLPRGMATDPAAHPDGWLVDPNSATATELALLPRVGPSIAQRIIDARRRGVRFSSVEQLESVRGIGPVMRERIRPWVGFAADAP